MTKAKDSSVGIIKDCQRKTIHVLRPANPSSELTIIGTETQIQYVHIVFHRPLDAHGNAQAWASALTGADLKGYDIGSGCDAIHTGNRISDRSAMTTSVDRILVEFLHMRMVMERRCKAKKELKYMYK